MRREESGGNVQQPHLQNTYFTFLYPTCQPNCSTSAGMLIDAVKLMLSINLGQTSGVYSRQDGSERVKLQVSDGGSSTATLSKREELRGLAAEAHFSSKAALSTCVLRKQKGRAR